MDRSKAIDDGDVREEKRRRRALNRDPREEGGSRQGLLAVCGIRGHGPDQRPAQAQIRQIAVAQGAQLGQRLHIDATTLHHHLQALQRMGENFTN